MTKRKFRAYALSLIVLSSATLLPINIPAMAQPAERQAYYGETHVHTKLSFDAFIFGNRNGPDEAYRFAKGEKIFHPAGFEMKLRVPLDFQAVTDHAMYLGMVPAMFDPSTDVSKHPVATGLREAETPTARRLAFASMMPYLGQIVEDDLLDMNIVRSAWQEIKAAADRHNDPGQFTAFTGYEYTSSQNNFENLHRNVVFADGAPDEPYSRLISRNPENLWRWMDSLRAQGLDSISIPHNSNGSDGFMFSNQTYDGQPITQSYTDLRMRNEPIVEVTQVKGTSETHPLLSPRDEFAAFEIMPYQIATWNASSLNGSYVREAYLRGLALQRAGAGNPYKFGLIGASDTHVGAGAFDENNYWSKIGIVDATGKLRGIGFFGLVRAAQCPNLPIGERDLYEPGACRRQCGCATGQSGAGLYASAMVNLGSFGSGRCLGRGKHARFNFCGSAAQGNLCHQRSTHAGTVFWRLRIWR